MKRLPTEVPTPTPTPDGESTSLEDAGQGTPARLFLLVIGDGVLATEPLPVTGTAAIGRANSNDICIDDASISREHATLHLEPLGIEDVGSANGVWVRDQRIPVRVPTPILLDQAVRLGSVTIIVQRRVRQLRARRRQSHEYFESRLEEECARGMRRTLQFAVLHLVTSGGGDVEASIAGALRETDIVAAYGPGEIELLLLDTEPTQAARLIERLEATLGRRSIGVRIGAAWYPRDSRDPSGLIAHARANAHGITLDRVDPSDIVVVDARMAALHDLVSRVAAADISVLIQGETGVGKEVIAEQIHRQSARVNQPFLKLNCAALTESLLESELFGHERGAFTGANSAKPGLLEVANGGVVFLDEVGEMHASTQAKLLRVLDEGKLMRVGGVATRDIDVRIVSATNRDLDVEVQRQNFRLDLLYRLNAMSIHIPPLRERPSEIEALAKQFLRQTAVKYQRNVPKLTLSALAMLRSYAWPGNVRELRNVIERAVVIATGGTIDVEHLPVDKMRATFQPPSTPISPPTPTPNLTPPTVSTSAPTRGGTDDEDKRKLLAALEECGGNQTHAARLLGISRRAMITKLDRFGVRRPRKR